MMRKGSKWAAKEVHGPSDRCLDQSLAPFGQYREFIEPGIRAVLFLDGCLQYPFVRERPVQVAGQHVRRQRCDWVTRLGVSKDTRSFRPRVKTETCVSILHSICILHFLSHQCCLFIVESDRDGPEHFFLPYAGLYALLITRQSLYSSFHLHSSPPFRCRV